MVKPGSTSATPARSVIKILTDESGQSLIIATLCMTCLIGFVALAADVGTMLHEKRLAQSAADSAAIAGALELNYGDITTAAQSAAALNGFAVAPGTTVAVHNPPQNGQHATGSTSADYVEVIVSQTQPTFFMRIFGTNLMTVTARAVATNGNGSNCIYTLGATGTDINLTSGAGITVSNCGVIDDSSSAGALTITSGATLTAQSIGVVGTVIKNSGGDPSPTPVQGIAAASDPLASLPAPGMTLPCPSRSFFPGSTTPLSPGCFSGLSVGAGATVNLSPGTYFINGSLNVNSGGTINGTGVTLYITNSGSVNISSGATLALSAPVSGTYNGILFFQDRNDPQAASFSSGATENLKGVFYFPDAGISMNSGGSSQIYAAFVSKTLTATSGFTFQDYASLPGVSSPLTSVRLAE